MTLQQKQGEKIGKSKLLQELSDNASLGSLNTLIADKKSTAWQNINQSILPSLWKHLRQHLAQ